MPQKLPALVRVRLIRSTNLAVKSVWRLLVGEDGLLELWPIQEIPMMGIR